jgi:hypothetical protein
MEGLLRAVERPLRGRSVFQASTGNAKEDGGRFHPKLALLVLPRFRKVQTQDRLEGKTQAN